MDDKKIDVAALRSAFDSLTKAVSVVADAMKEFAACLDDPAIMAALHAAMTEESVSASEANPWRYFMSAFTECVRRVRNGEGSTIYHKSGGILDTSRDLTWHVTYLHEITEDAAISILGGRPWDRPADV